MAGNTNPIIFKIHLGSARLLRQEVQVVHELRVGHASAEESDWSEAPQ